MLSVIIKTGTKLSGGIIVTKTIEVIPVKFYQGFIQ